MCAINSESQTFDDLYHYMYCEWVHISKREIILRREKHPLSAPPPLHTT
jgi:hypothetical protein